MRNESLRSWDIKTFLIQFNCSTITAFLKIVRKVKLCRFLNNRSYNVLPIALEVCVETKHILYHAMIYYFKQTTEITNSGSSRIKYDFIITIEYRELVEWAHAHCTIHSKTPAKKVVLSNWYNSVPLVSVCVCRIFDVYFGNK